MEIWTLRVIAIYPEALDTKTIQLQRTDGLPLLYRAGQFLTFLFTFHGHELRRSYSFSSTPGVDAAPAITVKRIPNGEISRYLLDHLKVGDTLTTLPPPRDASPSNRLPAPFAFSLPEAASSRSSP